MGPLDIPPTLVLTGHFPPEPGGVQTFAWELVRRLPADRLTVVAPYRGDAAAFDDGLAFPVERRRGYLLMRGLRSLVRRNGCEAAWVPAFAPFGLYVPFLRRAGIRRVVASTHGQELGWLRAAPTRIALGRMAAGVDVLTHLNDLTAARLRAVGGRAGSFVQLAGGVDTERFTPAAARPGSGGPLVVSVARLVRRKGHDVLLAAWPRVLAEFPDARLLIVGTGPMRDWLVRYAAEHGLSDSVTVAGPLPDGDLPAMLAAADAYVLACRDARRGLQTEGLGLSVLEASACGTPVVVGRSGGSPHALVDGVTGTLVVRPDDPGEVADALLRLLRDPDRARAMGAAGRDWVCRTFDWDAAAATLAALLRGTPQA